MSDAPDRRALLQNALAAIDDLQAQLDRVDAARREPIAIVGMSARFPAGANSPEAYWDLLMSGRDAVSTFPEDRIEMAAAAGFDVGMLGEPDRWHGGFLDRIDGFDAKLFGISPREANTMDPQQRLVLEVAWEALERASIAPDSLDGSATGVFVGITTNEFSQLAKAGGPEGLDVYTATGGALNAASGRLAYTLGLRGPCMAIDTACSSSLVALHQACQSLRTGESDMALAGGVNVLILPEGFICFDGWGMMAADGRCKTFDSAADGFVRGEGCGMLVLKRLSDAQAAADPVLAVIRGSAVNQDGASSGLTVPNGPAQQEVLRKAYTASGLDPADVQYVEAHGTGTALGDPIEVEAIGAVLGRGRPDDRTLTLGSVKSNIGHLESAAGIAGVIKVVLAMRHGVIPPNLHYHNRNPRIPWPRFDVAVPTAPTPWQAVDGRRLAGVSGFGFSGTNAHLVLESAPVDDRPTVEDVDGTWQLVPLSAASGVAVESLAGELSQHLAALLDRPADVPPADLTVADVAASLTAGRALLPERAGIVASTVEELRDRLATLANGGDGRGVVRGRSSRRRVGFLCAGQGSQSVGMGRALHAVEPTFAEALERCASAIGPIDVSSVDWWSGPSSVPLLDVIFADSDGDGSIGRLISETCVTQPALFAIEFALAELWRSWGVEPAAVSGHSVGEIVAAMLAGVFSLEDGARLIAARGRLMQRLPTGGAMAAVFAPEADVRDEIALVGGAIGVAAVNGPAHVVVSGDGATVASVVEAFDRREVRTQHLDVSHAFHSTLMDPMLDEFADVARSITYRRPSSTLVTNRSGTMADDSIATPEHWIAHVVEPVRFAAGLEAMRELGIDTFVELGPHPVLLGMARAWITDDDAAWIPSLRRGQDDHAQIITAAAELFVRGASIDPSAIPRRAGRRIGLPTYPFERRRHWVAPVRRRRPASGHPLLGTTVAVPTLSATIHDTTVAADMPTWLADHRLSGTLVFPGSAYLEMVLAATGRSTVERLDIREPLVVADASEVELQTIVSTVGDTTDVQIVTVDDGRARVHARATIPELAPPDEETSVVDPDSITAGYPTDVPVGQYYDRLEEIGLTYGPMFRGLTRLARRDGAAVGLAQLPAGESADGYILHPALVDACFHVLGAAYRPIEQGGDEMLIPISMSGARVHAPAGAAAWCAVDIVAGLDGADPTTVEARLRIYREDGTPAATIDRLVVRPTPRAVWQRSAGEVPVYELALRSSPRDADAGQLLADHWLVVGGGETAAALADALGRRGAVVSVASEPSVADADGTLRVVHLSGFSDRPDDDLRTALALVRSAIDHPALHAELTFVTAGARSADREPPRLGAAGVRGLASVIANEHPRLGARTIDVEVGTREFGPVAAELTAPADDDHVVMRGGRRLAERLVRRVGRATPLRAPYRLDPGGRGSLEQLSMVSHERTTPAADQVEIEIRATGINFRDVLNALGMLGEAGPPGLECAGVVTAVGDSVESLHLGERVVGIAPDAFASHAVTDADLLVRMPDGLTFAEAATLPIAYLTADYGLRRLAGLRPGERVLIHAGAGGVGMAAIRVAHQCGAEVFTTVSTDRKRDAVADLGVRHVYNSRSLDFADQILADTDGAGVDVVLNSLADQFIAKSFDVLAPGGRFLELGKRGIRTHEEVAASHPGVAYHPYDLADFLAADIVDIRASLQNVIAQVVAGSLTALPVRAFPVEQLQDAFRFVAQAKHIGKVVVTHPPSRGPAEGDATYLVTGGLGGLGVALAEHLARQGAGRLVLVGRRPPGAKTAAAIEAIRAGGTLVEVVAADISKAADVQRVVELADLPDRPLRGVFHAAGITEDAPISEQSWDSFERVFAGKVDGAELLDAATRRLDLDQFVLFSSASAILGSPGQANYASANATLDAIGLRRRSVGLPGLTVNWGAWGDVGMLAELDERAQARIAASGFGLMAPEQALDILDDLLVGQADQVAVLDADWNVVRSRLGDAPVPGVLRELIEGTARPDGHEVVTDLLGALTGLEAHERPAQVTAFVREHLVAVLGLDPDERVDPDGGLTDLGMDSLMAVELSNRLGAGTGLALPATLALEYPTLSSLVAHLCAELGLSDEGEGDERAAEPASVAELTDDEVTDRLLSRLEESGY